MKPMMRNVWVEHNVRNGNKRFKSGELPRGRREIRLSSTHIDIYHAEKFMETAILMYVKLLLNWISVQASVTQF